MAYGEIMDAVCEAPSKQLRQANPPTLLQNLNMKKSSLEAQLKDVNDAISALEANPEVEKILNLIGKTGRY